MRRLIETCIRDYAWIHTIIGLLGNVAFVTGSVLFLLQQQRQGTLFFIVGSVGMLIGNLGNAMVMAIERRWKREREQRKQSRRAIAPH